MEEVSIYQRGPTSAFNLDKLVKAIDDDIRALSYDGSLASAYHLTSLLDRAIRAKQMQMRIAEESAKNEIALCYAKGESVSEEALAWALSEISCEDEGSSSG